MEDDQPAPLVRFIGISILGSIIILWLSGIVMLYGSWLPWLFDLHRFIGFALLVMIPWKATTMYRSVSRETIRTLKWSLATLNSVILLSFILLIIILGLMWMWRLGPYSSLKQTLLTWHWILGVLITPLLALHALHYWPHPKKSDFLTRRSLLKMLGLAGASIVFGRLANMLAEARTTEDLPRRFTGSRGFGVFSGNNFPSIGEATVVVDPRQWHLVIDGAVNSPLTLSYQDILTMQSQVMTAAIDCHNGWYSVQEWKGISLANLLEEANFNQNVTGVRMVSVTELSNTYPINEALNILLATHVSGEVLEPSHGFPMRAVVPGRRAWFWLKWVVKVEVLLDPLEVVSGILCTPFQVFRELDIPRISTDIR